MAVSTTDWQVESLIRRAFERTKDRFLSYFLISVLGMVLIGLVAAIGIVGIIIFTALLAKAGAIMGVFALILFLILFVMTIYLSAWIQLAATKVLIQKEKAGSWEVFGEVKPQVAGFVWFMVGYFLFSLLILPLGFLSFFIIFFLWGFWSSFAVFVYLEKKKKGLENLWYSRAKFNQRFWGVLGRMILVSAAVFFVTMMLSLSDNGLMRFSSVVISLVTGPFIISFYYELYKNLPEPKEVKTPYGWMVAGIVGWILALFLLFYIGPSIGSALMKGMKEGLPTPQYYDNEVQNNSDINIENQVY